MRKFWILKFKLKEKKYIEKIKNKMWKMNEMAKRDNFNFFNIC